MRKSGDRAAIHKGVIRFKKDLFLQYCGKEPRKASAFPRLFFLSCGKISLFEVLCSFAAEIFSRSKLRGGGNT